MPDPQSDLRQMFDAAVAAADPHLCLPPHLPPVPAGRTVVVGAGKAAAAMAAALETHWPGPLSGLVITRYGHAAATRTIEVLEAAHPTPDLNGVEATARLLTSLDGLTADDLVICLLSGGGSALLTAPPPGVSLEDKRSVVSALLRSGAPIAQINAVRRRLSRVKGGRLRQAAGPARVLTLAISDAPGDDPATIASGPTVADPTASGDALAILQRYGVDVSPAARAWLADPASQGPQLPAARPDDYRLIATPALSLEAAARVATDLGYQPVVLGDAIEGEARDLARRHAAMALNLAGGLSRDGKPIVLISGGETTVTVVGSGRGGRNTEYLLALGVALDGAAGIHALAADTDGIDGVEDNAGAILAPDSLARAAAAGVLATARLADNDAYGFFGAIDGLVFTGPTRTNVNDFRAIILTPRTS
ncbi:glycerate kinase [Caulobacter sp.]|uniref:glycerate kinase type-2 family protein n=1 Tax=Caulobacter sp. TaxID=78 RepID=UPI001B19934F|nr:glycerate kinase [Caulobacter sp.]MBO9547261.1 glycerate kinase [Caulobacter sp.]